MFKQKFAIKTLNTILITPQTGDLLTQEDKLVFLGILRDNGYILNKDDLQKFLETDITVNTGREVLETVKTIRGGDVVHQTLLTKFPIQDRDQWGRSLIAFVNHISGFIPQIPTMLQDDVALYQLSEKGNLVSLTLSENIDAQILTMFTSKIPLSLEHEEFIAELYKHKDEIITKVDPKTIVLKEILARQVAMEITLGLETVSAKNAIDVLRAIAIISGEPNAKLDEKFKIKALSNPIRRKVVEVLDKVANIDDLVSKKALFKTLFKLLHVHESKYAKFGNIRALAKELQTVNNPKTSRTELYKLVNGIGTEAGFDIILGNPSLFIRNLDAILRKHDADSVLQLFQMSLHTRDVETKLLLQILEHFRNRDKDVERRTFTAKGKSTPVVVEKGLEALEQDVIDKLDAIIKNELKRQYSKSETYFEKSYIHPSLYKINLPKGLSDQDGMKVVARGSRYKFKGTGDTIRMFVHWKDRCDIDLSAIVLDENYSQVHSSINFGNLSGNFWEHSGDVRSAPSGGSEFIDIYLEKLPKGTRYIGMAVNCYSGKDYDDIPELFGGFMVREDRLAGKKFEPKTVEEKFSITGGTNFKLCVLFDVLTREVIMINSSLESGSCWSIRDVSFKSVIEGVMNHKTLTVGELLELRSRYVLCEDEQLAMTQQELESVQKFDEDYGFNVLDITSNLL